MWEECIACPYGFVQDPVMPTQCVASSGEDDTWVWVLVICGGAFILAMIPALWYFKRTRRKERQLSLMEVTVLVAKRVAASLADYAVEEAEGVIETDGAALPQELRESYQCLLSNLKVYKDYLPDCLLRSSYESYLSGGSNSAFVPGMSGGDEASSVGLVFTDIQSSTMLWGSFPKDMHQALQIHNRLLRQTAEAYNGYEVKVIGDALMLAFANAQDAA
eukprot:Hpha_TRINITY_DN16393_c3_g3::TRINITY_DN16393_c3_g3_i4::g.60152::m.60152